MSFTSKDIPDLSGRIFLVTGGNKGLGYETIKQLAAHNPEHIYLSARDASKGEAAIARLRELHPNARISFLKIDLSDLSSVAAAAKEFQSKESRLHCLLNNAGIMATPPGETKDGYEVQFGTNYMGHALLTKLLLPTLQATAADPSTPADTGVRIINLTTEGHNFARTPSILLDQTRLRQLNAWTKYGYSKLALIVHARELATRYPDIISVSIHPGIVKTDLFDATRDHNPFMRMLLGVAGNFRATIDKGALNSLWAAAGAKKADFKNGAYYVPVGKASKPSPAAQDGELPGKLWAWTEEELNKKGYP